MSNEQRSMLDYFVSTSRFRKLTLLTAIVTYALVVLGGIVRVTGSGLGCPDWPLCYGQPLPSQQIEAILEMAHRYVAALVTLLIIVVAVTAWRGYRRNKWIFRPAMAGAGVIFFQPVSTWIGGEKMEHVHLSGESAGAGRNVEVTGVDFYGTIEALPLVRRGYALARVRAFDTYDLARRGTRYLVQGLRARHSGVLPVYLRWFVAGLLAIAWVMTQTGE